MRKKNLILGFSTLCLITFGAVSCGGNNGGTHNDDPVTPDKKGITDFTLATNSYSEAGVGTPNTFGVTVEGGKVVGGQNGAIVVTSVTPSDGKAEFIFETDDKDVIELARYSGAFVCKKTGTANVTVKVKTNKNQSALEKKIKINVVEAEKAQGAFNYQANNYEQRAEITGLLEGWAMDNHLTGITLFQNGGYVLYNNRLKLGADHYIPGFGYGNLSNGKITAPANLIDGDQNEEYKWYYHTILSTNPKDINYLNSQGEVVGDLFGYISTGLWNTKLNDTRDGYDWYNCLAKEDIIPINPDPGTGLASKFEIKVKTGDDGLTYQTASKKLKSEGFNDRPVVIEDYLTAYQMLLTQYNKLSRGAELTSPASDGTLKGAAAYYNLTSNIDPLKRKDELDELFKMVGIKVKPGTTDTLQIELAKPTTKFYAKYALSGNLLQPIPFDFVKKIGGMTYYGTDNEKAGRNVVDDILCLGPYLLEEFDNTSKNRVIFKLNEKFIDKLNPDPSINSRYQIKGIYSKINAGAKLESLLNQFKLGVIDACGVPSDQLKDWIDKPECHLNEGDSTFKLNVNSSTQEEWDQHYEEVFKDAGIATSYKVKPIMSNDHFLKGLNESIDRLAYAKYAGATPSQNYFGSGYLYDPETGKSYNDSVYHQANLATRFPETYGYNKEAAIKDFQMAVKELTQQKLYTLPCTETIDIYWMNTDDPEVYGNELARYFEEAFNDPAVSGGQFTLKINNIPGSINYEEVYSQHLQVGNYDLGFGSISGNSLNPLNFLEVLKSDNSSGFTLNWGRSTAEVDPKLIYDGKAWSFDSLWTAGNSNAIVGSNHDLVKKPLVLELGSLEFDPETKAYDVLVKWSVDSILAGVKDTKLEIDTESGITVTFALPKSQTEVELVFVVIDQEDIVYDNVAKTIAFRIPYNELNPEESDKIIASTEIRVQVAYKTIINGTESISFYEEKFLDDKFDDTELIGK